jgi:hypothetical protein
VEHVVNPRTTRIAAVGMTALLVAVMFAIGLWDHQSSPAHDQHGFAGGYVPDTGTNPKIFTGTTKGIVPASGGGTSNFLRADGTWAAAATTPDSAFFSDGLDGNLTFDCVSPVLGVTPSGGVYLMPKDVAGFDVTIANACTVDMGNFRFFARGTLTGSGTATISNAGMNGGVATICSAGSSRTGKIFQGTAAGGGARTGSAAGIAGGNASQAPLYWTTVATTTGAGSGHGQGGAGGSAGANTGGAGGSVTIVAATTGRPTFSQFLWGNNENTTVVSTGSGGGGGAVIGGTGTGCSGSGGAPGGMLYVGARTCAGTLTISVKGGNGSSAIHGDETGAGGGGGGGGGVETVVCGSKASTYAWTYDVSGGTAGAGIGTGTSGFAGSAGTAHKFLLSGNGSL